VHGRAWEEVNGDSLFSRDRLSLSLVADMGVSSPQQLFTGSALVAHPVGSSSLVSATIMGCNKRDDISLLVLLHGHCTQANLFCSDPRCPGREYKVLQHTLWSGYSCSCSDRMVAV
jgi:hypothetical protein